MKKTIVFLIVFALAHTVFAQTPGAGQSYVTNTYVVVHPYVPTPPNSSTAAAPTAATDQSAIPSASYPYDGNISFRLNKGTKFVINKVISSTNNEITGYIITVWNYTDYNNGKKKQFYDALTGAKEPTDNVIKARIEVINQQAVVREKQADLAAKSKIVNTAQQNLLQVVNDANQHLLATAQNDLANARNAVNDAFTRLKTDKQAFLAAVNAQRTDNRSIQTDKEIADPYQLTKTDVGDPQDDVSADDNPAVPYDPLAFVNSWANEWQFFITAKDLSDNTSQIFPKGNSFTWGFLTLPLKLRFDNPNKMKIAAGGEFNFEQNLNFGLTFGLKHQLVSKNDVSINYLAGISVVSVPLTNKGATLTTTTDQNSSPTSTTGVSTSAGVMLQYGNFQIGTFGGMDFAGDHAEQFAFQGRFWMGFAIGVSLFGANQTTAPGKQTQN